MQPTSTSEGPCSLCVAAESQRPALDTWCAILIWGSESAVKQLCAPHRAFLAGYFVATAVRELHCSHTAALSLAKHLGLEPPPAPYEPPTLTELGQFGSSKD